MLALALAFPILLFPLADTAQQDASADSVDEAVKGNRRSEQTEVMNPLAAIEARGFFHA